MRQYLMTGVGLLAGFFIGAFIFGAMAGDASQDVIIAGELFFGTVVAAILGAAGWFGAQSGPLPEKKRKKG